MRDASRLGLASAGLALGIVAAMLAFSFPDSGPLLRLESLWQPPLRDVRKGGLALDLGHEGEASAWYSQALREPGTSHRRTFLLRLILDSCERRLDWEHAAYYAQELFSIEPDSVNRVHYGEALIGAGRNEEGRKTLAPLILDRPSPGRSRRYIDSVVLAEADVALSISCSRGDLSLGQKLTEDGIKQAELTADAPRLLVGLNDAAAWIEFTRFRQSGDRQALEMARIDEESAVDGLEGNVDATTAATVLYRLSLIRQVEGDVKGAAKAAKSAGSLSPAAFRKMQSGLECSPLVLRR